MVLKLKDACLNYIAKNFNKIENFNKDLLTSTHKEIIIERLFNHDDWETMLMQDEKLSLSEMKYLIQEFKLSLIRNFLNGYLSSIKFNSSKEINDKFLKQITEISCDELAFKSLTINQCHNLTDMGLSCFLAKYSKRLEEVSLTNLEVNLSLSLTEALKSTTLITLDLSYCLLVQDNEIWSVCKNNPNLKSLKLTNCKQLTNNGVRAALHMLNKLENLDVELIKNDGTGFFVDQILSSSIMTSSINFKNIKKLTFCGSDELNNSLAMKKLFESCPKIKELNIVYSSSKMALINDQLPIGHSPLRYVSKSLESLSLYSPNFGSSDELVECLIRLENLKHLSLYAVAFLNDDSLIQILETLGSNLTTISLGNYMILENRITDKSIKYISRYCSNLKAINFNLFSLTATLEPMKILFEQKKTAAKFEEICFSACRSISYNLLTQLALNCFNLRKLDLSGLTELLDDLIIKLISKSSLRLTHLDVKGCKRITDDSIVELVVNCSHLEFLVLAGIVGLTDKSIFAIANHLQFSLSEIYLSGCKKISAVSLRYLSDCCMKRLYISHRVPNLDPNQLMAKNLDTGNFERVDLINY